MMQQMPRGQTLNDLLAAAASPVALSQPAPALTAPDMPTPHQQQFFGEGGLGRILAGAIGDGLLQHVGMQPVYAPAMRQQGEARMEDVKWQRDRMGRLQDWQAEQDYTRAHPAMPQMMQDAQAWQTMTPDQRTAYQQSQDSKGGMVNMTLPNGQFYAGPKSGIADALGGGQSPPTPAMGRPVGKLTPINGGPTQPASGGFRR